MSSSIAGAGAKPATRTARLPWVLFTLTVVLLVSMVALSLGQEELVDTLVFGLLYLTCGVVGALVASRQPANPIGWIFCGLGVWGGTVETWEAFAYNSLPTGTAGQWVTYWGYIINLTLYALVFLLFPTGGLMTRRWRLAVWPLVLGSTLAIPGQALSPNSGTSDFDGGGVNPLAVEGQAVWLLRNGGLVVLLAGLIAAIASVVIRYRRASGVERLQLRQFVLAGSVIVTTMVVALPFYDESAAVQIAVVLAFAALPVAAGLAILRYRLYEIDVVVNRALVYGSLTATLATAYLGSVLLLQLVLSGFIEGSGLAVAASTLAVAALFRPVRARIQRTVDRRFFRRKYDAVRTLEAFGARLRDEVDLHALESDLRAVVADTMQPAHVTLWLRSPAAVDESRPPAPRASGSFRTISRPG